VDEGERRGIMADALESNYLYNLNEEMNIDAKQIGSLMKYVNNSFDPMANCYAKIIFSEHQHKVALYASRTIEKGEELFFDYGYPEAKKEQISWIKAFMNKYFRWSNDDSEGKKGSKKGKKKGKA